MNRTRERAKRGRADRSAAPRLRVVEGSGEPTPSGPTASESERPGADIRTKILSLVVLSALLPAALVGFVSYLTARNIQEEELSEQLSARVAAIDAQMERFFSDRLADSEVFANSFVISEGLDVWRRAEGYADEAAKAGAAQRIGAYLKEVHGRYPLYRELAVYDASGDLVAGAGPTHRESASPTPLPPPIEAVEAHLRHADGQPLSHVVRQVRGRDGEWVGTLVTAGSLEALWTDLANAQQQNRGRTRVIDPRSFALFDSAIYPESSLDPIDSDGMRLALAGEPGFAHYLDEDGEQVVAAYRTQGRHGVGVLVELTAEQAYAVSHRLRDFALLSSLLAAGLIAALGFWVVVGLTRPIAALTSGAQAAAQGNLGIQIPVTSRDEIGHLTRVFNKMVRSLQESRAKLQELSSTDELTGLYNRRHLTKMFEIELGRTVRSGRPLSVLMIDLDHFKSFNDRFGHLEGDNFLRLVGSFLTSHLRPTDVLARYGGEEFILLLPDTNNEGALLLAERLREQFVEELADSAGLDPAVTISVGVATTQSDKTTRDQLIAAADAALYDAKREGRNCVRVAV